MNTATREVLDRLGDQLKERLPQKVNAWDKVAKIDTAELAAVASATRDYLEAESIYAQTLANLPPASSVERA